MKPHKWAKEIKAWADGAEIEYRTYELDEICSTWSEWKHWAKPTDVTVNFLPHEGIEYRIKSQPKEPQYLYVYESVDGKNWITTRPKDYQAHFLVGKIKLETD